MEFIKIKPFKIKKATNIFIPTLLGAIILIGNIISVTGYNFNIQQSFAKETQISSSPGVNSLSHLHHHSSIHTARQSAAGNDSASQQNFNTNTGVAAEGQSTINIDPTAMSVPFGGVSGISGSLPNLGNVITHSSTTSPICTIIKQTIKNQTVSNSLCKSTTSC